MPMRVITARDRSLPAVVNDTTSSSPTTSQACASTARAASVA